MRIRLSCAHACVSTLTEEATEARDAPPSEISPSSTSSARRLPAGLPAADPAAISRLVELRQLCESEELN